MNATAFRRNSLRVLAPKLIAVAALASGQALAAPNAAVPVPAGGPATAEGGGRPMTLAQAIASALAKNDDIRIARVALASADASVTGARGAYDPLFTVDAGWESAATPANSPFSGAPDGEPAPTNRTTSGTASLATLLSTGGQVTVATGASRATTDGAFALLSPAYDTRLGLELRQPLLRDRAIDTARLTLRVAAADRSRAAGSLRQQVADTVAAAETAYWGLVAARRAVGVREDAVALATQQLRETKARIESGSSPENEVAQPTAELERRRGDLLAASEAAARAETNLKRLVLGDEAAAWAERIEPVDEIAMEIGAVDVAAAMDGALASRPELAIADSDVVRRRAEATFAHDRVRPAFDLVASYDRFGLAGSRNPNAAAIPGLPAGVPSLLEGGLGDATSQLGSRHFDDARVALELRLTIGNRAARANERVASNARVQAEATVASLRKAVRAEVLNAGAATDTAGARIDAARSALKAAEVQLAAEEDRFRAGLSTNFLVLTRQNDLASARLTEIQALADYRTARTELARATGTLLEERGIELE